MEQTVFLSLTRQEFEKAIREQVRAVLSTTPQKSTTEKESEILNIEDVAKLLMISKARVYHLTSNRLLPFSKRGRRLIFFRSEILDWIKQGKIPTQQEIESETCLQR